ISAFCNPSFSAWFPWTGTLIRSMRPAFIYMWWLPVTLRQFHPSASSILQNSLPESAFIWLSLAHGPLLPVAPSQSPQRDSLLRRLSRSPRALRWSHLELRSQVWQGLQPSSHPLPPHERLRASSFAFLPCLSPSDSCFLQPPLYCTP